jgi:two-component system, NtrC family, response regulator AtoC
MAANSIETLRLLVVSSEASILRVLDSTAQSNSWHLEATSSGWDAMERVQFGAAPHLLLLDVQPGDGEGLNLLPWLRRLRPELPIVVLCDPEDGNRQKEATRLGAKDVLLRPLSERQLESVIRRHLRTSDDDDVEPEMASEDIESLGEDEFFLSVSPAMQQLRAQAELLAQTDVPVLILGEPGSGKGTVARLIHQKSVHSGFKFLRVNCAEMPADLLEIELFGRENGSSNGSSKALGKLESGQKGTILLDEITEMPLPLQSRILKVLQEKRFTRSGDSRPVEVDIRILAASSDKLDQALAEKRLHPDLYYRLSAFTVNVPPLRHRKEEIKILLRYSMHKVAKYYALPARDFTQSALDACQNHSWPGNLKELETFVKRYLIAGGDEFNLSLSEPEAGSVSDSARSLEQFSANSREEMEMTVGGSSPKSLKSMIQSVRWETERNAIAAALEKTGWNRKAAARLLGVSYRTILYKIEQYEMSAPESYLSSLPAARLSFASQNKGNGKAS